MYQRLQRGSSLKVIPRLSADRHPAPHSSLIDIDFGVELYHLMILLLQVYFKLKCLFYFLISKTEVLTSTEM